MKLLLTIVAVALFTGCNNDDDSNANASVYGQWSLVKVQGGIAGTTHEFDMGTITWIFNPDNQTVTVINNNTDDSVNDGFDSGVYDFQVLTVNGNGDCDSQMTIDELFSGCMNVTSTTFKLSQQAADGFEYTLKR
ncbi:MAG: hypothetical protein EOO50_15880 [Flavobacterium sp.]|uniref:hypothetical protein n=1 Tax=Flavobacterium sp. TaxID=239 RepID=UPI0011FCBA4E|nr:hypothetical protein [Flavobacterium sp.]RZJ64377.1 MAG: hypothetical protein EOO50_15880 [Flavobacterium sp.]